MVLLHNSVFLLFLIICIGEACGNLQFRSFSFGSSAIIFIALVFGHFGFVLQDEFQLLGLILFIYSIALQAGPGFFSSFKRHGLPLALGAVTVVFTGFVMTLACSWFCHLNNGIAAGLFAGALTSTPGLAVAVEGGRNTAAPAAYGLTYCFGVIGVILFINLIPKISRINIHEEEKLLATELTSNNPPITVHHIEITNHNLIGKTVSQIFLKDIAPVVITRLLRQGAEKPILVSGNTVLKQGDHLRLVGRERDIKKIEMYMGRPVSEEIEFNNSLSKKHIVVSKKEVIWKTIGFLNFKETFNVQVTRLTRNGIELPASSNTRLHMGDILHIVGDEDALRNITKILGNNAKAIHQINMISLLAGLCLGLLFGKINLTLPLVGNFSLGTTGGVLVAGLLLSNLYKTGPFIWEIPVSINSFIRELGLVMFLATVGTKTGATLTDTVAQYGLSLFLSGIVVTLVPLCVAYILCRKLFKIRFLRILGVLTGGMTSTPGLAAASSLSDTPYPSAAYATVYPVALIGMILFTKLILLTIPYFG